MLLLEGLGKSYGEKTLFSQLDMALPKGKKIALVGQNGAGKTTLLNILCGIEEPDSGRFLLEKGAKIGYLPQEPSSSPQESVLSECESGAITIHSLKSQLDKLVLLMAQNPDEALAKRHGDLESAYRVAGGYSLTARATSILHGLGFSREVLEKSPLTLSGGWRMRLELAKIFLNEPEFLILDEPTNHLDLPSLVWVEVWLRQFKGTLLFVSHDRALLNRLSTHTLFMGSGRLKLYTGNFDAFLLQKETEKEREAKERLKLENRRKEHQKFVDRFGAKANKAKQAQSRVKMIDRLRALEENLPKEEKEKTLSLSLPKPSKSAKKVLSVENLSIGYEESKTLARGIDLSVLSGQKIAVIGANGIGKSTFLKTLVGEISSLEGDMTFGDKVTHAYFAQNQSEHLVENKNLLDTVLSVSENISMTQARSLLGSLLFSADDVYKEARVLSGGEKNRLGLACLLAKNANFLLLDEPTNHLDMVSVEMLIEAFSLYEGTLVFVSHDRTFIDALCTHVFVMLDDGRSELFIGKLSDYERAAESLGFPNVLAAQDSPEEKNTGKKPKKQQEQKEDSSSLSVKPLRSERNRLQKDMAKQEKRQDDIRGELSDLEKKALDTDPTDYEKMASIQAARAALEEELARVEEDWLVAGERVEEITRTLSSLGRL